MPHIIVEYTPNLAEELDVDTLLDVLHETALGLGVFPRRGTRTLAMPATAARVGDRPDAGPDNGHVQIRLTIAPGRPEEVRGRIADELFAAAEKHLEPLAARRPVGFQLTITEFDPTVTRTGGSIADSPGHRPPLDA
ncbi:hypothetical protein ACIQVO_07965 [Streptomyces sp. NPDC101062]|uniref:hypothetical protein n=1 Tax=unclassified Streptomyces TaxID=2593676 RepID=UPI002E7A2E8E|nr:hypothetical protein [Streptomyces sp. JV176]MEE1799319.1 hypothetical protein [Streptomyces sp. JV176]